MELQDFGVANFIRLKSCTSNFFDSDSEWLKIVEVHLRLRTSFVKVL